MVEKQMRKATYWKQDGSELKVEYDENAPCLVCGEPVISASMGGTAICPSCDLGRCRYCGMTIFVIKPELDGGESKKRVLKHMEWHHKNTPEIVERVNSGSRKMSEIFDKKIEVRKQSVGTNEPQIKKVKKT